jgi:hypothetical protein
MAAPAVVVLIMRRRRNVTVVDKVETIGGAEDGDGGPASEEADGAPAPAPRDGTGKVVDIVAVAPGAPPAPRTGPSVMLTLDVSGQGRLRMRVDGRGVIVGRERGTQINVGADRRASQRHARLFFAGGSLTLCDLESRNGTYLNGTRIQRPEPVRDRDCVQVGLTEIRVYLDAA